MGRGYGLGVSFRTVSCYGPVYMIQFIGTTYVAFSVEEQRLMSVNKSLPRFGDGWEGTKGG